MRGSRCVLLAGLDARDLATGSNQQTVFSWYRGRIGDFTRPLQTSTDPTLTLTATDAATSFFWVQAVAGFATSSADIGIEVFEPRRRPARLRVFGNFPVSRHDDGKTDIAVLSAVS